MYNNSYKTNKKVHRSYTEVKPDVGLKILFKLVGEGL